MLFAAKIFQIFFMIFLFFRYKYEKYSIFIVEGKIKKITFNERIKL